MNKTVKAVDLPHDVRCALEQYMEANPRRFDGQKFDVNGVWGLEDAIDGFLQWNGIIGWTRSIMDIIGAWNPRPQLTQEQRNLLEEAQELLEGYLDVRDTEHGPAANKAMQASQAIDVVLGRRPA